MNFYRHTYVDIEKVLTPNTLFFHLLKNGKRTLTICSFADDTTPYVCSKNLEFVLSKLEEHSNIAIEWFENSYMKMNSGICHLFVSSHKYEHLWAKVGNDKIWETRTVKLLGITIDNELKYDEHLNDVCLKAKMKLSALMRIRKYL